MKITKLQLKGFRSHANTSLDLDRFTFIVGPNAAGKSSIAYAIEMLLTGRCAVTDANGKGADDLVKNGEREFYISGQVGRVLVERTKGPSVHVLDLNGRSGPISDMQENIYEGMKTTRDVLSAVLNAGRFIHMPEPEQKKLLAQVLATEAPKIPAEILADMRRTDYPDADVVPSTIQEIDDAHKFFYDQRRDVNRDLKALGELTEPELPADMPEPAAVRKKLDGLREEKTKAETERSRLEGRHEEAIKRNAERRLTLARQQAVALEQMLPEDERRSLEKITANVDKRETAQTRLQAITDKIDTLRRAIESGHTAKVAAAKQKAKDLGDKILSANNSLTGVQRIRAAECPSCQRPLSAKDKEHIVNTLTYQIEDWQKELNVASAEACAKAPPDSEEIKKLRNSAQALEADIREFGDIDAAEAQLRSDREAVVEESRCKRELKALADPAAPDTSDLATSIATLNERISNGEGVLEKVKDIETARTAYATWKETRTKLQESVEVLERLIAFFGPSGVKASMVGDKIGPFIGRMNEVLGRFDYAVAFTLEPYSFKITGSTLGLRTIRQLSESEKFRFGVAFQIALAMATGLKFVVIDGADILLPELRSELAGALLESELDQAIVLSSSDQPAPETTPENVKFISLA